MRNQTSLLFLFILLSTTVLGQNRSIDTLDLEIKKLLSHFETPGIGVAIVEKGKILYSKGFGTRTIGSDEPVDNNTLFAIGSISKSFTAVALAMLVDEGKLNWDDKVIKYVPYFELYDPYVTNTFTIRDLLTHRSGLKQVSGGTLWYHSDRSREEIIKGLKHLKAEKEFRTSPAYQNVMFVVASKVVEAVIKGSWDDFIRKRIFEPIGMKNTVILEAERKLNKNLATAHIKDQNLKIIPIEQEKLDNIAPAGSFYSSANDMANYMNFMLNDGIVGKDTLISKKSFNELLTPQIYFPFFGKPYHNEFTSYGFGWWLTPKDGNVIIEHSGSVDGMGANLMMEKNSKIGVIALSNSSYSRIDLAVTFKVLGELLKDKDYLKVPQLVMNAYSKSDSIRLAKKEQLQKSKIKRTKPSLALDKYVGLFTDKMYGDIYINKQDKNLKVQFSHTPLFTGILTHWHYDTFEVDWLDPRIPNGFIIFEFDSKGQISGFKVDQPSLSDVDFTELEIKKNTTKDKQH